MNIRRHIVQLFIRSSTCLICSLSLMFNSATAEQRKLGFSGPLSGSGAGWGNDVRNVLMFANEKLTAGKYAFVFEDDRCDPKTSLTVSQKLLSVDRVREVFVVCGQAVLITAPIYNRSGITILAPLATPSRISELGVFRTGLSDALAAKKLAQHIHDLQTSVSVLTEQNDYTVEFLKDFSKYADSLGLKVSNEDYLPETQDFRPQLLRLKARKVDALFLNTQTENALASLVRQLKELSMTPKLYGAYLPGSAKFLEIAGSLADGIEFVDFPGAPELLSEEGKKLYSEYLAKYGPLQGWTYSFPAAFEIFRAVHLAIESGQPVDEYLHNKTFEGIFGRYSFDKKGDVVGPEHVMRLIKNGRSELMTRNLH